MTQAWELGQFTYVQLQITTRQYVWVSLLGRNMSPRLFGRAGGARDDTLCTSCSMSFGRYDPGMGIGTVHIRTITNNNPTIRLGIITRSQYVTQTVWEGRGCT